MTSRDFELLSAQELTARLTSLSKKKQQFFLSQGIKANI